MSGLQFFRARSKPKKEKKHESLDFLFWDLLLYVSTAKSNPAVKPTRWIVYSASFSRIFGEILGPVFGQFLWEPAEHTVCSSTKIESTVFISTGTEKELFTIYY